jgi:DNA (cytosine-5)-methyltransferase 1
VNNYNYIDLFHGIGGFALGAYWSGMRFKNHFCSDIEPYTQELYKLRFPDSIQLGDITKIDTKELLQYGDKWIITGGFPCQDISIAGKGAGITGARSGLWFEHWRIIRDLRPRIAIMENVSAITFRGLNAVLGSLAEIGYNAEWQNIRASDVGLPHTRERTFIVAYSIDSSVEGMDIQKSIRTYKKKSRRREFARAVNAAIPADDYARNRGNHDGVSGVMDQLKGLGNAIVPQIAEILFNQIKPYL